MTSTRLVHIVDDEESMRRSTGYALKTAGYAVTSWVSGAEFLREVRHVERGCILLDIRMPEIDGLEVQQILAERGITMPIVVMTGHGDIGTAVRAMKGGAADFLEKPFERTTLLSAIETAFERIARAETITARAADAEVVLGALTPRERDVLDGLAHGLPNKTIAYDLGISPRTVEVHRANLMTKLEVRSLSDALRIAFAAGMGIDP
ncbi:MAG: DNA-binding response regulator [Sphingomonas sp. 66-10]|uniref:response regulator transcription factor n=1 Tax=Sphingomonas sp. 66-10 TaxID=1895848 RepID=UPI0009289240|nr:response regulator [Sphingomonas sp. 66-10]OJU22998.1 MAG: DNA-binding response regulator [Sphingomonas sp. 66-10]